MSNHRSVDSGGTPQRQFNIPPPPVPPSFPPQQPQSGYGFGVNTHFQKPQQSGFFPGIFPMPQQHSLGAQIPLDQNFRPNFPLPPPGSNIFPPSSSCLPPPSFPPPFCFPPNDVPKLRPNFEDSSKATLQGSPSSPSADWSEMDCDKIWIRDWLKRIKKEEPIKKSADTTNSVKIFEMKEKIMQVKRLVQDLESQSKSLSVMMKSLTEAQWKDRVEEVETKKRELFVCLNDLTNNDQLTILKQKLDKRNRKRKREKRKRLERKRLGEEIRVERAQASARIDLWFEGMQEAVERGRREEELRREADCVLGDVTKKKAEAKRQLALLEGLGKLHKARVVGRTAMGLVVSEQQKETFNAVVDRLTDMWNKRLESYNIEEHGLKVMLNEAAVEEISSSANRQKIVLNQWENALFGTNSYGSKYLPQDSDAFLSVRKDWDRFVVPEDSVMSSSIPAGWVLPSNPSSDDWEKLLLNKKT